MERQLLDSHFTAELFVLISFRKKYSALRIRVEYLIDDKNTEYPQNMGVRLETELAKEVRLRLPT